MPPASSTPVPGYTSWGTRVDLIQLLQVYTAALKQAMGYMATHYTILFSRAGILSHIFCLYASSRLTKVSMIDLLFQVNIASVRGVGVSFRWVRAQT